MQKGEKKSTKKKLRKLEKRIASLESMVVQYRLENSKQLWEDVAPKVKENPLFKKLVGG